MTEGDQGTLDFDGATIREDETAPVRLTGLWNRCHVYAMTHEWWTLAELAQATGGTEASVSARFRDFRKKKFGEHVCERELIRRGLYRFRVARSLACEACR